MLDKKTAEQLRRIHPSKEQLNKIFTKVNPHKETAEKLERALCNPKGKMKDKRMIAKVLENPIYRQEKVVVNEKEAKKLEKETEGRVQAAIRRGDIKRYDPRKDLRRKAWERK